MGKVNPAEPGRRFVFILFVLIVFGALACAAYGYTRG